MDRQKASGLGLTLLCAIVGLGLLDCAGNPNRPSSGAIEASQQVETDSARGNDFARLFIPGDTLWPGVAPASGFPKLPREMQGQDTQASMLFAVIVDSTGRIEPASRTVIAAKGDPRVVKAWCDFLIVATLAWKSGTPRRSMVLLPILFFTASAPTGQEPKIPNQKAFDRQSVAAMLDTMPPSQRQQWFADQQPCSSLPAK